MTTKTHKTADVSTPTNGAETLPAILLNAAKDVNTALDDTAKITLDGDAAALSFIIKAEGKQAETFLIPQRGLLALAIEGAKRTLSKDTASSLPKLTKASDRDAAIREVISAWTSGYADMASKKRAEKAPAAAQSGGKFKLPFGRLLIEAELNDVIPNDEKAKIWLKKVQDMSDEIFTIWVEKQLDKETTNPSKALVSAIERLTARATEKAEREKAEALAAIGDLNEF